MSCFGKWLVDPLRDVPPLFGLFGSGSAPRSWWSSGRGRRSSWRSLFSPFRRLLFGVCLSRWPGCVGLDLVYPTPLQLEQARYSSRRPLVVYESSPGIFGSLTAVLVFRYYLLVYLEHSIHADYATIFSRRKAHQRLLLSSRDYELGRASFALVLHARRELT